MRPVSVFSLAAALGAIALLPACAGNSPGSSSLVPSSAPSQQESLHSGARVRPLGTCTDERRDRSRITHGQSENPAKAVPYLYVADQCEPSVDVLNSKTYYELGSITNGVSEPYDVFVDLKGNLYEADGNGYVNEYSRGSWSAPSFTYSANTAYPFAVTVDDHGNVYEGDDGNGYVNEYYQEQNGATVSSCQPFGGEGAVKGVAVDNQSDVFVQGFTYAYSDSNELVEYPGGLNSCASPTILLPLGTAAGGIALDKNRNLLIANGTNVEVVDAPSYSTVSGTIGSGFCYATTVRLNKANTLAFVADDCNDTVTVVNYPGGTNAAVLGTGEGLIEPYAAVAVPNAVY